MRRTNTRIGATLILSLFTSSLLLAFQNCSQVDFSTPRADETPFGETPSITGPGAGSLLINNGATYTNDTGVILSLTSDGAEEMYVTNASTCGAEGDWEPYNKSRGWVLNDTNKTAYVYAKFRKGEGDSALETNCVQASIIHDNGAPTVRFESGPDDFTSDSDADFVVKGDDALSGISFYECRIGGESFKRCSDQFRYTGMAEGPHKIYVRVTDKAGNRSSEVEYPWLVDQTAPIVTILDPKPPTVSTSSAATLRFQATDTGSGIYRTYCKWDTAEAAPCESPSTMGGLADGSHTFSVYAVDMAGNMSAPASYTWTVHTQPSGPFNILGVTGGSDTVKDEWLGSVLNPTIHWEPSTGAVSYSVSITNEAQSTIECGPAASAAAPLPSHGFTTAACSLQHSKKYYALVTAYDFAGLTKDATPFKFTVDIMPPVINIQNPRIAENQVTTIDFTITDIDSGVKEAKCYRSYMDSIEVIDCKDKTSLVFENLGPGTHSFYISATDNAGNQVTSPPKTWTIKEVNFIEHIVTVKAPPTAVDLLVVVDNSGSMRDEQQKLSERLNSLIATLEKDPDNPSAPALNWQICLTSTDPGRDGQLQRISGTTNDYVITKNTADYNEKFKQTVLSFGTSGSGNEQGIYATVRAVERNDSRCFRQDAALAVIVISDEDELSLGWDPARKGESQYRDPATKNLPATAVQTVRTVLGDQKVFTYHSLIIKPGDTACLAESRGNYGTRYAELSGLSNGIVGSICAPDYGTELERFAGSIRRNLDTISLACIPIGSPSVTINPNPAGQAWVLEGNKVKFTPSLTPGTVVDLKYYCPVSGG